MGAMDSPRIAVDSPRRYEGKDNQEDVRGTFLPPATKQDSDTPIKPNPLDTVTPKDLTARPPRTAPKKNPDTIESNLLDTATDTSKDLSSQRSTGTRFFSDKPAEVGTKAENIPPQSVAKPPIRTDTNSVGTPPPRN